MGVGDFLIVNNFSLSLATEMHRKQFGEYA